MSTRTSLFTAVLSSTILINEAAAQFTILHTFNGADGKEPASDLTLVGSTIYGTTSFGGAGGLGTVFSMSADGGGFQSLHSFVGNPANAIGPLGAIAVSGTTLVGTTAFGQSPQNGTVFNMSSDGSGFQTLLTFGGLSSPLGTEPALDFTLVGSTLYGSTVGTVLNETLREFDYGTIYRLNADGSGFQPLHIFAGGDGVEPNQITIVGSTIFGTTQSGGPNNAVGDGTIFELRTDGTGFQMLHAFTGGADGAGPSTLTQVGSVFYGTTHAGGTNGSGVLFSLNTDGTGFDVLSSLPAGVDHVEEPLTLVGSTLYGVSLSGGAFGSGEIFSVNTDGTDFQVVHNFALNDKISAEGGLILSGSTLYGTERNGGSNGDGTVFALTVPEPSSFVLTAVGLFALAWRLRRR